MLWSSPLEVEMLAVILLILLADILGVPCGVLIEWINAFDILKPPLHVFTIKLIDYLEHLPAVLGRDCRSCWDEPARHVQHVHNFGVKLSGLH